MTFQVLGILTWQDKNYAYTLTSGGLNFFYTFSPHSYKIDARDFYLILKDFTAQLKVSEILLCLLPSDLPSESLSEQ